ncbi:unnamed protein product [Schistosoma mattheei]|uniref:Uncharacterized protein n=1 Tax=Schistosoma mattheei TaxID=31246 RepID=A0A183NIC6_9TREM|nr:unnamed protein product [Schistosoma mattheei]
MIYLSNEFTFFGKHITDKQQRPHEILDTLLVRFISPSLQISVFLQSFDILIENINNLESSKLQKLTCVTQSPYILLDGLLKFVLLHGNFGLYEHLLLFLRKKVRHFKELNFKRQEMHFNDTSLLPTGFLLSYVCMDIVNLSTLNSLFQSQLDNIISENAFSQTTLKFENDQVELIRIISDNITKWIQPYLDASYVSLHEDDRMDYIQNDLDKSLYRVMDFNDMVPFLIFKSDYASLLYLNRYTDNRMILLL